MPSLHGDYGHKKCSTHYETVHAVVYDTVYKKKCSEGSDEKCKIIHIHSYKVFTIDIPDFNYTVFDLEWNWDSMLSRLWAQM